EDQADPEAGSGLGQEGDVEREPVPRGVPPDGGEHSERNPEAGGEEERAKRELQRRRDPIEHVREDGPHRPDGLSGIAARGARGAPARRTASTARRAGDRALAPGAPRPRAAGSPGRRAAAGRDPRERRAAGGIPRG